MSAAKKSVFSFPVICVFITAGPITKLFAGGGGGEWTTCAYDRRRAEACVDESARHALRFLVILYLIILHGTIRFRTRDF